MKNLNKKEWLTTLEHNPLIANFEAELIDKLLAKCRDKELSRPLKSFKVFRNSTENFPSETHERNSPFKLTYGHSSSWSQYLLDQYKTLTTVKSELKTKSLAKEKGWCYEMNFLKAYKKIEENWPEGCNLIQTHIDEIFLVDDENLMSTSLTNIFGLIIVAPKDNWTLMDYIETLIHEASHLELFLKQIIDPMLLNPNNKAFSSLRGIERPMQGILHSAFILKRCLKAFEKMKLHSPQINSIKQSGLQVPVQLEEKYFQIFAETMTVLNERAHFTEIGKEFFKNLKCSRYVYS